jgi:UDP-N-acetylglucosamine diphosphorylase/glucosamine-1-phosphate N-acetyltransferase
MTLPLARMLRANKTDTLFVAGEEVVALKLSGEKLAESKARLFGETFNPSNLTGLPTVEVEAVMVRYPWDLVYANETELTNDFFLLTRYGREVFRRGEIHKAAVLMGKKNIHVGKKATVGAGAVLDAGSGPIYVGRNVTIHPNAVVEGPCFVGDGSTIKAGARIYGNTSIGPVCKVGGEVEHSILHSYSNKQHDGFLGHSFLGPWVNLGAGTTTSNLKNTYGTVKVHVGGRTVDSGRMFIGLTAADHVKTGINATLDTGTVIGPSSNIYGTAIPPKYVPPFSWGEAGNLETYDVERALAVAVKVMARRNVQASQSYLDLFRYVFSVTSDERTRHTE